MANGYDQAYFSKYMTELESLYGRTYTVTEERIQSVYERKLKMPNVNEEMAMSAARRELGVDKGIYGVHQAAFDRSSSIIMGEAQRRYKHTAFTASRRAGEQAEQRSLWPGRQAAHASYLERVKQTAPGGSASQFRGPGVSGIPSGTSEWGDPTGYQGEYVKWLRSTPMGQQPDLTQAPEFPESMRQKYKPPKPSSPRGEWYSLYGRTR